MTIMMALMKQKVEFEKGQTLIVDLSTGEYWIEGSSDDQILRAVSESIKFRFQKTVNLKMLVEPSGEKRTEFEVERLEICLCPNSEETSLTINGQEISRSNWSEKIIVSFHLF